MCLGTWSHDGQKSSGTARVQRDSDKMDIEEVRASQKGRQWEAAIQRDSGGSGTPLTLGVDSEPYGQRLGTLN
ncbi:hypothetical protein CHARACLAT_025763 [Characodon lateralis]|uniref:MHC class I antigen n=1 Tax=Characodon lateralis TaxID=208331 RepID=A0ABU7EZC5_9TELE|nr:hypothetical protein [Characodon lateralis]